VKRVNLLYIIALLSIVILLLFLKIGEMKSTLAEKQAILKESKELVAQQLAYKRAYGDKDYSRRAFERIVTQPSFQKAGVHFTATPKGMKISAKRVTLRVLNSLMTKIFNGPYKIKILNIKRDNPNSADLRMEIVW
jgi:hypothetical protein